MKAYLGIDVGSVSTNFALISKDNKLFEKLYLKTNGKPVETIKKGLNIIKGNMPEHIKIIGVGTTGSGRNLAGIITGADVVKNEITAHAMAALLFNENIRTIIEIGGQDSKIIILKNGVVYDFAMNTVCAAGTGAFLEQQASRLKIPLSDFGEESCKSTNPTRIAGRCSVFAESDMIHKQQMGYPISDIIAGLFDALVRNYLNNVGKGKKIFAPIIFQGGVAANKGMQKAFEKALNEEILVPDNFEVMGAIGASLLAKETIKHSKQTNFKGFEVIDSLHKTVSFECNDCSNYCEIIQIFSNNNLEFSWGDYCKKWSEIENVNSFIN